MARIFCKKTSKCVGAVKYHDNQDQQKYHDTSTIINGPNVDEPALVFLKPPLDKDIESLQPSVTELFDIDIFVSLSCLGYIITKQSIRKLGPF